MSKFCVPVVCRSCLFWAKVPKIGQICSIDTKFNYDKNRDRQLQTLLLL